ncbi:MAG: serine/threonine protein kinase, partial [Xanthomonadales bacterium]|nr:serine/threonine protein kinase [Xanthomonadales bacterium]
LHVIEKIGEGSFGVVYRAYDPVLRRDVALKLARLDAAHVDPRAIVSEARRLARLRHPNILAVHGADQDQDSVGIWCDLLGGVTLQHVLDRSGTLPARAVLDLATPLCDALALVHARGFTHGDLKPANIMLEDDGTPVLMDFGAARDPMQTGSTVGSPLLMAPEQFDGVWSAASDLYAFGAMLFRCLSGRFPRVAADMAELERQHRGRAQIDFEP